MPVERMSKIPRANPCLKLDLKASKKSDTMKTGFSLAKLRRM